MTYDVFAAAEVRLPERVTQHDCSEGRRNVFFVGPKRYARGRLHAQHFKVGRTDLRSVDSFSAGARAEAERPRLEVYGVDAFEGRGRRPDPIAQVCVRGVPDAVKAAALGCAADVDQPVHFAYPGCGRKEQRIRRREDGGIGADADGQRGNSGECEQRRAGE